MSPCGFSLPLLISDTILLVFTPASMAELCAAAKNKTGQY
jgi:hypothetical protein